MTYAEPTDGLLMAHLADLERAFLVDAGCGYAPVDLVRYTFAWPTETVGLTIAVSPPHPDTPSVMDHPSGPRAERRNRRTSGRWLPRLAYVKPVLVALVVSSALVLAGCGPSGPGVDPGEYGAVVEEAPRKLLTEAQIEKALLTVKDLPDGWSLSPPPAPAGGSEVRRDSSHPACKRLTETLDGAHISESGTGDVYFSRSENGPFLSQSVLSRPKREVTKEMKSLRKVLENCPSYTETAQGMTITYQPSAMPFPQVGDDAVAMRLRSSSGGQVIDVPMVVIRVGRTLVMLASYEIGGSMTPQEFEAVARTAVKKAKKAAA